MFGFVVSNPETLTPDELAHYRGVYCGVCEKLGENRRFVNRLSLTYDLAFLVLVLSSVCDEDYHLRLFSCPVHHSGGNRSDISRFSSYAADMNILLAYYKCLDDVEDDGSLSAKIKASMFRQEAMKIAEKYPVQSKAVRDCLSELSSAEKHDERNADIPAEIFGRLMASLFTPDGIEKKDELYAFGLSLGKVIYIMDASVDLKQDIKKKRYNPLVSCQPATIPVILNCLLGECTENCRKLGLKRDTGLIDNILYSGIWTTYYSMQRKGRNK